MTLTTVLDVFRRYSKTPSSHGLPRLLDVSAVRVFVLNERYETMLRGWSHSEIFEICSVNLKSSNIIEYLLKCNLYNERTLPILFASLAYALSLLYWNVGAMKLLLKECIKL